MLNVNSSDFMFFFVCELEALVMVASGLGKRGNRKFPN